MRIAHSFNNLSIEKSEKISENSSFLLTNNIGGYCYLSSKPDSRYQGVFFTNGSKMFKVIDSIMPLSNGNNKIIKIKNNFFKVERERKNNKETFFLPSGFNSVSYEQVKEDELELILDIRESYRLPEFGRFYYIYEEKNKIIVEYQQENEFRCFLAINKCNFKKTEKWLKQEDALDKKRNPASSGSYVFSALKLKAKKLVFTFSFDKENATKENDFVLKNLEKLKSKQKETVENRIKQKTGKKIGNDETAIAYISALNSLNSLINKIDDTEGIFAGLPWFFQFWSRDEAISLKAISDKKKARNILERLIKNINDDGKMTNMFKGEFRTADSAFWVLKRVSELDNKLLNEEATKNLCEKIVEKSKDNFIFNNPKETWMDSIERAGARTEIQALKLSLLKIMNSGLENRFKEKVREFFWNKQHLADGIEDWTIRPNIFMAAYVYPDLLSKEEWEICFDNILPKLWLEWGGFSTIDKQNTYFIPQHTGEDSRSYHSGDSWFWLNNLAAIVLNRANKNKYKKHIDKIIAASSEEILWKGAVGHHSEISSASQLESNGCIAQAWSNAMFIELIEEVFR